MGDVFGFCYLPGRGFLGINACKNRARGLRFWLMMLCLGLGLPSVVLAQPQVLRVGMKQSAPFTMSDNQGHWEGISFTLWQAIATDLELDYVIEERDLPGLLAGLQDGSLDVVVGALTITEAREEVFDFSNSFFNTGLSIAVRKEKAGFLSILQGLFNRELLQIVLILVLGLLVVSLLIWIFERNQKDNPRRHYSHKEGIGWGIWWAMITLIGYDDLQPRSFAARVLAVIWMIASVIGISLLTAVLTTVLTINSLENSIQSEADLVRVQVASLAGSSSSDYLESRRIVYRAYPSILEGLQALANAEVDAMVYDEPLLRYLILENFRNQLAVLDIIFEPQNYAIALAEASPYREAINRSLLRFTSQAQWQELKRTYLGK